ncbi:MAG TPA: hypothetical protein VFO55_03785 [Gemmatimonadaceae bacterium]|nr:hypothetical protein [Gemmatimonadaceae bacterium]
MSRRRLTIGCLLVACGGASSPAGAQDLAALGRRLDESAARAARAQKELVDYRRLNRGFGKLTDTVMIAGGHIAVLSSPDIAPIVREAARRADTTLRRIAAVLPRVQGTQVAVNPDTTSGRAAESRTPRVFVRHSLPPYTGATTDDAPLEAGAIAKLIEEQTVNRALDQGRTPFQAWRRGALPLRAEDVRREVDWGNVRFDVLASRALIGPRCYRGEIPACSMLLGLTRPEDAVMSWYDSLARFDEVQANREWATRVNRAATEKCLKGDDRACGDALKSINHFQLPPGGGIARDALIREAIRLGGDRAVERMLVSTGSAADALAAGAGVPVDSVIRIWHRNLREGSLGSEDLTPRMVLVTLVWVGLLFFLSTRISRWR